MHSPPPLPLLAAPPKSLPTQPPHILSVGILTHKNKKEKKGKKKLNKKKRKKEERNPPPQKKKKRKESIFQCMDLSLFHPP
jgi:hypothetical protein